MSKIRDRLGDLRWRAAKGRTHVSNAWHRAAGKHISGARQQYRNWLNTRARARGKAPLPDRVTRAVTSRVPGYRNRVNPATGRPRRDDRQAGRVRDGALARALEARRIAAARQRLYGDRRGTFQARAADRTARPVPSRPGRGSR